MLKKIALVILVGSLLSCHKNGQQQPVCGTQACTQVFVSIGVKFVDANGAAVSAKNFTAINQRTKAKLTVSLGYDLVPGAFIIADDNSRSQLSTEGDDVLISATHPTTNQTKTSLFKIAGGCNCHVAKLSGPETIAFD